MSKQILMLSSLMEDKEKDELKPEYDISEDEPDEEDKEDKNKECETTHSKLMKAIGSLDTKKTLPDIKKRSKFKQRSEPTLEISEFHLNKVTDERGVKVHELLNTLQNTSSHTDIRRQLNNFHKKNPTLKTPLHKYEADQIQRTLVYNATSQEVSKWDEIVNANRKAEHMSFPLNQETVKLQTNETFVKKFKPTTPLEQQVYQLLKGSKHAEQKGKSLSIAEEDALRAMSLKEARERRSELQKCRALQSYYEAKCRRQKKIKSKKYHRIQRKEKAKIESKKLKDMMENNPEEAKELLIAIEKSRAQERMSLKHKNTGKWAKGQIRFGKYNKEARDLLKDQLEKSRELTQKIAAVNKSDDEDESVSNHSISGDEEENAIPNPSLNDINNPWFVPTTNSASSKPEEDEETIDGNQSTKYTILEPVVAENKDDINLPSDSGSDTSDDDGGTVKASKLTKSIIDQMVDESGRTSTSKLEEDVDDDDDDEGIIGTLERRQTFEKLSEHWESSDKARNNLSSKKTAKANKVKGMIQGSSNMDAKIQKKPEHIDPKKVFTIQPKVLDAQSPNMVEDEEMTEAQEQRMNIQQAFADDDVVQEFKEEKMEKIERDRPKDVDLTLPGWGHWGGVGVKPSKKKKWLVIKAPPTKPRTDEKLQHVIINEQRNKHLAMHQVNDLPHSFKYPIQFERSIRAPIGNHWNTALTVKSLTVPKVTTKIGTVIDPISGADVFENKDKKPDDVEGSEKREPVKRKADIMFDDKPQGTKKYRNKEGKEEWNGKGRGTRNSKDKRKRNKKSTN